MDNHSSDSFSASPENTEHHSSHEAPSTHALVPILEALLFASQKALSSKELFSCIKTASAAFPAEPPGAFAHTKEKEILEALHLLSEELAASQRSYELRETASGWQLVTKSTFAPWVRQLFPEARPSRLSAPALETLAIIAYRQPITRADVEAVRGVAVDGVVQTLMDRGLIRITGRADIPGRPLLYATSEAFLNHFGLRHLDELPNATELGAIPLPKAADTNTAATNAEATNAEATNISAENTAAADQESMGIAEEENSLEASEEKIMEEVETSTTEV